MRDSAAKTITNLGMVEEWRSRPKKAPRLFPFNYAWSHVSTGNSGTGIIHMPSKEALVE